MAGKRNLKICVICVVCLFALVISGFISVDSEDFNIPVYLHGIMVLEGTVIDEVTYVSLSAFLNGIRMEADIYWDESTNTATITNEYLELIAAFGDLYIYANGRYLYVPDGVLKRNELLMVPLCVIARVFNVGLVWSEDEMCLSVTLDMSEFEILEHGSTFYDAHDLNWLSRVISAEARDQSLKGMIAVGNVVLNRVEYPEFPDTIHGVIFDVRHGIQFHVIEGAIFAEPTQKAIIAAKISLEGYNVVYDAMFFVNPTIGATAWFNRTRTFVMTIGCHNFFS